jgi:hypothetical protein
LCAGKVQTTHRLALFRLCIKNSEHGYIKVRYNGRQIYRERERERRGRVAYLDDKTVVVCVCVYTEPRTIHDSIYT